MLLAAQMPVTVPLGSAVGSDGRIEGIPGGVWHKDKQK